MDPMFLYTLTYGFGICAIDHCLLYIIVSFVFSLHGYMDTHNYLYLIVRGSFCPYFLPLYKNKNKKNNFISENMTMIIK